MTTGEQAGATESVLDDLVAADREYREAAEAVRAVGEDDLDRLADALDTFTDLLDRYEVPASGSGRETFEAYVEFESALVDFTTGLPDDLPAVDAFGRAEDILDKRRLTQADFDRARDALDPAESTVAPLEDRDAALARYRRARSAVAARIRELDDRIDRLEEVLAYGGADLDAPTESLRDPIDAYNRGVRTAFDRFVSETDARGVLQFVRTTQSYPLVAFESPPDPLREYLGRTETGGEPIPRLLEYAEYTRSKLSHYVGDPSRFRARVVAHRAYLEGLSAEPLTIPFPPPPADTLRWRLRELVPVVGRFAPEGVLRSLHAVRDLARNREEFARLRTAARAHADLDADELDRLASGSIERDRDSLVATRDRLRAALEDYPER